MSLEPNALLTMSMATPKQNEMRCVLIETPPSGNWRDEYSFPVKEEKEDDTPMMMPMSMSSLPEGKSIKKEKEPTSLPEGKKIKKEPTSLPKVKRIKKEPTSLPKVDKKTVPAPKLNKEATSAPELNKEATSAPKVNKRARPVPKANNRARPVSKADEEAMSVPEVEEEGLSAPEVEKGPTPVPEVDKEEFYHPSFDEVEMDSAGNMKLVHVKKKRKLKVPGPTPEELAARDASSDILRSSARLNFTAHTSCAEINNWLAHMNNKHLDWHIHTRLVTYTDRQRKLNELSRIARSALPQDFKDAEKHDWSLRSCLSSALYSVRTTGTILMFSAPIWNPIQLQERTVAFHTYVVIYKNRNIVIADPAYKLGAQSGVAQKWRESELTYGMGLAAKFMAMVRKKFIVEKSWYGKGTKLRYNGTNGNILSQDFILEFLERSGEEVDWEEEGFVEVIP